MGRGPIIIRSIASLSPSCVSFWGTAWLVDALFLVTHIMDRSTRPLSLIEDLDCFHPWREKIGRSDPAVQTSMGQSNANLVDC